MSSIKDCPFCNLNDRILKGNGLATVFLSNPHKVPGHFLVVPRRHVEKPWQLSKDEVLAVFDLVFFTQEKLEDKLGGGSNVRQNYSPFVVQNNIKIDHVHYHIVPRSDNDRIYQLSEKHDIELFEPLTEEEHNEMAKLLD